MPNNISVNFILGFQLAGVYFLQGIDRLSTLAHYRGHYSASQYTYTIHTSQWIANKH